MNTPRKKVASSLGGIFDVNEFSAGTVVSEKKETKIQPPSKSSEVGDATQPTLDEPPRTSPSKTDASIVIPESIAAGEMPFKRSGKRRTGVSRKYNNNVVKTTIVLPEQVHDKLTEITFRNRKTSKESMNDLVMQGLDLLFADYGIEPIDKLVSK